MIGDSHLASVKPRSVEKAVGGRLFTPGYRSKEDRAYCSTRNWPEIVKETKKYYALYPCIQAGPPLYPCIQKIRKVKANKTTKILLIFLM